MIKDLNRQNAAYWQNYKPGEIPSMPVNVPNDLLINVSGPVLDVGTGDGVLAEKLSYKGLNVFGIDIAKNIIEENLKRNSRVKYSVQDITHKTKFKDNFFDLIIFKFTLTNIHQESWKNLGKEIYRVLKPYGTVWVVEPLVSESYNSRYKLSSFFIKDANCVYVFNDKSLAKEINTKDQLQRAIDNNQVSRIIKHYTLNELTDIFGKLEISGHRTLKISSPSNYLMNTFEGVFTKKSE